MTPLTVTPMPIPPALASLPTGTLILCSGTLLMKLTPLPDCEKSPRFSVVAQAGDGAAHPLLRTVSAGDTVVVPTGTPWSIVRSLEVRL